MGPRLQAVAAFVPPGCRLADIGSDHGYLPARLLLDEQIAWAVAGEVNQEPALRAVQTARLCGLTDRMQVRVGSGLTVLQPGEVDTVVIAGMGGSTIIDILQSEPAVVASLTRLILQPNVAAAAVRQWLHEHGWCIKDEALAKENDIIYEVIMAVPGAAEPLHPLAAELGPVLLQRQPILFPEWVEKAIAKRQYIASQLLRSQRASAVGKRRQLLVEIKALQDVME